MRDQITAGVVQFNIRLGNVDANLTHALTELRELAAKGAQLAVMPEMWSSGYDYKHLAKLAEETPRVIEALETFSREAKIIIVGSLPELRDGRVYNCSILIEDGAVKARYRKLHLFSNMGEDRFLAPGEETIVVPTKIGKIGLAICYDLRFPELFRSMALDGAEIICIPAEWPKPRQEHWRTLLRARAIENQLFVVGANCCGIQGKLDFFGMSMIVSSKGEVLAEAGETDTTLTATLDFAEMTEYRSQIRCFTDRRPEIYGDLRRGMVG